MARLPERVAISRSLAIFASLQPTRVSASRLRKLGCTRIGAALIFCRDWSRQTKPARCFFSATRSTRRKRTDWEFVNYVVAPDELETATRALAERLREAPPIAIAAAKHAVYMSQAADLEEMLRYETEAQMRCFESLDGAKACRAFLEKRAPKFTGR